MPRKTDSNNPADWLYIAGEELRGVRILAGRRECFVLCHSKLAEILEKILKAELIRTGWVLEKTHDLLRLFTELESRKSDLLAAAEPLCRALVQVYFTDRYPGFDLADENWPELLEQLQATEHLMEEVRSRVGSGRD